MLCAHHYKDTPVYLLTDPIIRYHVPNSWPPRFVEVCLTLSIALDQHLQGLREVLFAVEEVQASNAHDVLGVNDPAVVWQDLRGTVDFWIEELGEVEEQSHSRHRVLVQKCALQQMYWVEYHSQKSSSFFHQTA